MKKWIVGIIGLAVFCWFISIPEGTFFNVNFWKARRQIILFTGFLTYVMMACVMVLALRLTVVERRIRGLDKVYHLHKWLGILACSLGVIHWSVSLVPKVLVRNGFLERSTRRVGIDEPLMFLGVSWKDFAEIVGEWTFYFVFILILLALIRKFPYHWFRRVHKLMAIAFLLLTFHALVLIPGAFWLSPAGAMTGLAALCGFIAAAWSLSGAIGAGKRYRGIVRHIEPLSDKILHVRCELEYQGMARVAGQFVFVRFAGTRDPHPFTISSSFFSSKVISFYIKVLGDDTRFMMEHLQKNTVAQIEGPYGQFDFVDRMDTRDQIWVAAGIGVTPFLARMEVMAEASQDDVNDGSKIHFYYCCQAGDVLFQTVKPLALAVTDRFEIHDELHDGKLEMEKILAGIPDPHAAQLWFCGPVVLGKSLERAWKKKKLSPENFHREYFQMR